MAVHAQKSQMACILFFLFHRPTREKKEKEKKPQELKTGDLGLQNLK